MSTLEAHEGHGTVAIGQRIHSSRRRPPLVCDELRPAKTTSLPEQRYLLARAAKLAERSAGQVDGR
jgi:hypothetical protein